MYDSIYFDFDMERDKEKSSFDIVRNEEWERHEKLRETIEVVMMVSARGGGYIHLGKFKDGNYFYSYGHTVISSKVRNYSFRYKVFKDSLECLNNLSDTEFTTARLNDDSLDTAVKAILTDEEVVAYYLTRSV